MALLVLGIIVFFAPHVFTMVRGARAGVVARIGEGAYKGLYSLVSLAGLALLIYGFAAAPYVALWTPPTWARHLAIPLVWAAFVLATAAYLPGAIQRGAKHPMLAGIKLWAFAHLLANGDLAGVLLFGSFLVYGVIDRIAVKRRALIEGAPQRVGSLRNDILAVVVGTVAFLVFGLYLHPLLIGRVAIPT
jgi:uncharacterized membrane protein